MFMFLKELSYKSPIPHFLIYSEIQSYCELLLQFKSLFNIALQMLFITLMVKLHFQKQYLVSQNSSLCWFAAQETFLIFKTIWVLNIFEEFFAHKKKTLLNASDLNDSEFLYSMCIELLKNYLNKHWYIQLCLYCKINFHWTNFFTVHLLTNKMQWETQTNTD